MSTELLYVYVCVCVYNVCIESCYVNVGEYITASFFCHIVSCEHVKKRGTYNNILHVGNETWIVVQSNTWRVGIIIHETFRNI